MQEIDGHPHYKTTMQRLEAAKHTNSSGVEYWMAREVRPILGYVEWRGFENVIERARAALRGNGQDPSHHIVQTNKKVSIGSGAQREAGDHFLSRPACYLIAMNGDPSKPEIAAAQAYFAIQTRRIEIEDTRSDDEKRLELREKVAKSAKLVSGVAKDAGVRSEKQGLFHGARYEGLYGMSLKDIKARKGLADKEQLFDHAGLLELSANDFQMNLAADVLVRENVKSEAKAIATNKSVGQRVRRAMEDSHATLPENLPLETPIREVKKRVAATKKISGV